MATTSRSVPHCGRIKTEQIKSNAQLLSKDAPIVYKMSAWTFIGLITSLNILPSSTTFIYDENLPMWTGAAKIWRVSSARARIQKPSWCFGPSAFQVGPPFVVGRVCSLGECTIGDMTVHGTTWKRRKKLENERCDEGSRWITTHVNTESQLLYCLRDRTVGNAFQETSVQLGILTCYVVTLFWWSMKVSVSSSSNIGESWALSGTYLRSSCSDFLPSFNVSFVMYIVILRAMHTHCHPGKRNISSRPRFYIWKSQ